MPVFVSKFRYQAILAWKIYYLDNRAQSGCLWLKKDNIDSVSKLQDRMIQTELHFDSVLCCFLH